MAELDNDDSTSLLGEALEKLMAAEDEQPEEPIHVGHTMEFHRYMDLPSHIRKTIRKKAIDQEVIVSRVASVSKKWQRDIELKTLKRIRINPSVKEDVLMFKQVFKTKCRRWYLEVLQVIIDDRPTGPWHTANGIVGISLAMEKVGRFFRYLSSWKPGQGEDLEVEFVSVNPNGKSDLDHDLECGGAYLRGSSIQTTSLWSKSQLIMLGNSNLPFNKPPWAIWSHFRKSFGIAKWLTFPLDCVPLYASMAIIATMPNLEYCTFELAFERMAEEGDSRAAEEGIARLADFFEKLPSLAPSLRELRIRVGGSVPPDFHAPSAPRLAAAVRDSSQSLETLEVKGLCLHQDFFEPFGENLKLAKMRWDWTDLKWLDLQVVTFGPGPGPFSKADQLGLTPTELLIAAGRAAIAMPLLGRLKLHIWHAAGVSKMTDFSLWRKLPRESQSPAKCELDLRGVTEDQDQRILCAWTPFLRAKPRFVRDDFYDIFLLDKEYDDDSLRQLSVTREYETFPEDYSPSTTFGAGALVNNASFLEAQRLARTKSGIQSVPNIH